MKNVFRETAAKLKEAGDYFPNMKDKQINDAWDTITGDTDHKLTACIAWAEGHGMQDPGGYCKAMSLRVGYEPKKEEQ